VKLAKRRSYESCIRNSRSGGSSDAPAFNGTQQQHVMLELAVALYAQGILSYGKARELTTLKKADDGFLPGQRGIPRHYTRQDVEDDIVYAHCQ